MNWQLQVGHMIPSGIFSLWEPNGSNWKIEIHWLTLALTAEKWLLLFRCPRWSHFVDITFLGQRVNPKNMSCQNLAIYLCVFCVKLSMANSLWDSPLLQKTDLTGKLTHYHHSHLIRLFSSTPVILLLESSPWKCQKQWIRHKWQWCLNGFQDCK